MASAIRGSRVGAGPMGEAERGDQIERATVSYFCGNGHEVRPSFAVEETVVIPAEWVYGNKTATSLGSWLTLPAAWSYFCVGLVEQVRR